MKSLGNDDLVFDWHNFRQHANTPLTPYHVVHTVVRDAYKQLVDSYYVCLLENLTCASAA